MKLVSLCDFYVNMIMKAMEVSVRSNNQNIVYLDASSTMAEL